MPDRQMCGTSGLSVLLVSNYFPPEVNAPANRSWEHAREWARVGGSVEVLVGPPHFPEGCVYPGFENRLTRERHSSVDVLRVPMYVHANTGIFRRTLSYVSFMVSAVFSSRRLRCDPDVVIASSPHLFAGLAGLLISKRKGVPFVLEVRDLWPESIVDVGALPRGGIISLLERLETFLYRSADHVVIVSPAFRAHIERRGVDSERITLIANGVDLESFAPVPESADVDAVRARYALKGRFVVSYIGTVGMAHNSRVMLEAARACDDPKVLFLVIGAGSAWEDLKQEAESLDPPNFLLLEKQTRDSIRLFYEISDVNVVHLADRPAFRKVIPSKMFEAMAVGRPIILGVLGEAARILAESGAGLVVTPDSPRDLNVAVLNLKRDAPGRAEMGRNGTEYVNANHNRRAIARQFWTLLRRVADAA